MREKLIAILTLGAMTSLVSPARAATVTLYLTTVNATPSVGIWQLFIADSMDNDGLANFDVDVVGTGGVVVNTAPTFKGPRPADPSNQYADGAGRNMGFNTSVTNGSNLGTGRVGITGGQNTVYSGTDDPTYDMGVLVGVGQEPAFASPQNGSQGPIDGSGPPTGLPISATSPWGHVTPGTIVNGGNGANFPIGGTLMEQGTDTDTFMAGILSANVDGFGEVLGTTDNGNNELWGLPPYQQGNTPSASIQPNSAGGLPPNPLGDSITFTPEPTALGLIAIGLAFASIGRRMRRPYSRMVGPNESSIDLKETTGYDFPTPE